MNTQPPKCRIVLVLATILVSAASAAHACGQRVFGGKLDPCLLDEVRALQPEQRTAFLQSKGLGRADWLPAFMQAAERYAELAPEARNTHPETVAEVTVGAVLAELLEEREAAGALKRIASTPKPSETISYAALLALCELDGEDEFLLAIIDHSDAPLARLGILAVGVRTDTVTVERLDHQHRTRGADNSISAALQFIDLYQFRVGQYANLTSNQARLELVESSLRRAYNPLGGAMATSDPYSAGHPLSRWALQRWSELAAANPEATAAFIRSVNDYPSGRGSTAYRRFLARQAGAAVERQLEPAQE